MTKSFNVFKFAFRYLLIICVLFLCTSFSLSVHAESGEFTVVQAWEEIGAYLEGGTQLEFAPGESQVVKIPLSNGDIATLEVGCMPVLTDRNYDKYTYSYTANGNYIFWGKISYDLIGSFNHRIDFNITSLSPACKFSIKSAAIEGQQPSVGLSNIASGITDIVNYAVGTSSYSKGYASYSLAGVPTNIYSKILMNSMNPNKIGFTVYYSMTPID